MILTRQQEELYAPVIKALYKKCERIRQHGFPCAVGKKLQVIYRVCPACKDYLLAEEEIEINNRNATKPKKVTVLRDEE